ncbi:MAG: methylmalonyl Co-A mutase-associated GTPase MeaB [Desulfobacterales bacterium]|nr:MAG: methylmalonyl Co-A mutase-associated GTPase MeaB [Desulfobacterales bacterium]
MGSETDKILEGNQLAGARLIRQLENADPEGLKVLKTLYPHTGKALVIGITGPAGTGKSTLVGRMITEFRRRGRRVGVVAVDPSSPYSGGALLGDRVRMERDAADEGVFIRSMATRGQLGGLSRTTREAVLVMDAMGYEVILIETVGVGQDEVDVAQNVHTTAVVSIPGMGDDIQAMKAGLLEIGDIFVVNKADRPGAEDVAGLLTMMLEMRGIPAGDWKPPVLRTVALNNEGIPELVDALLAHNQYLAASGKLQERIRQRELTFFRQLVIEMAALKIFDLAARSPEYAALLDNLRGRQIDPYSAAEKLVEGLQYKTGS